MTNQLEAAVRPGAGVEVVRQPLPPIRKKLIEGSYTVDADAQDMVKRTLEDPTTPKKDIKDVLNNPNSKGFRNAYASLALDHVWQPYSEHVVGSEAGVFRIQFDETGSHLVRVPSEELKRMSSRQIADAIAGSNQDVSTHFLCEVFRNGKVPTISGDKEKDQTYFDAFKEQTDLAIRAGDIFKTIPENYDSPSRFIASSLLVVKTHVFGLVNLVDEVSEREGKKLSPDQHRDSVSATLRQSVEPYYLPPGPLLIAINNHLVDPETRKLNPESWTSNGDPDKYVVFPKPNIVREVNEAVADKDLPVQTNCPAFRSRVTNSENPDTVVPFSRFLANVAIEQLDTWYYPQRKKEWPTDVFVAPSTFATVPDLKDMCKVM